MNISEVSVNLLDKLGGISNIDGISNCQTRIRVDVYNKDEVNLDQLKKIDGVIGVVLFGSQIQVVLGNITQEIANIFIEKLSLRNYNK